VSVRSRPAARIWQSDPARHREGPSYHRWWDQYSSREGDMKYEKPAVQRFGSLRELTLGNGPRLGGDAVSLYHRS